MHDTALQADLQRLCDEPDFQTLGASLRHFDPFKVLKVERYELRHTTTLAWLLDPEQTHGLGDRFLGLFLQETCGESSNTRSVVPPGQQLQGSIAVQAELRLSGGQLHSPVADGDTGDADSDIGGVRKTGELDILVESESWAVAIEAKIDSREGEAQLLDYGRYLEGRFKGNKDLRLLYLTVHPEADVIDENPGWTGISWGKHVASALRAALYGRYEAGPDKAPMNCPSEERALCEFLHRYLGLLERLDGTSHGEASLVQPLADRYYDSLSALKKHLQQCENAGTPILPWSASPVWAKRYWNHRQQFDILIRRMRSPEAGFAAAVLARLDASRNMPLRRLDTEGGSRATFRFVPEQWTTRHFGRAGSAVQLCTLLHYHVAFRAAYQDIEIKLLMPNIGEHDVQVRLLEQLLTQQQARGTATLKPSPVHLGVFLDSTGSSLKLYSNKLAWQVDSGIRTLTDGADEKIDAFWRAVAEHTALIEKILAAEQHC